MKLKSVSFIGSFRKEKHYSKIREIIKKAKENNIEVLSPAGTDVVDSIDDFVIFSSDDSSLAPDQIEDMALEKILASDVVYVCDVDGYVGITTAYEIAMCICADKDLYFMKEPIDLPVSKSKVRILPPDELIEYLGSNV